MLDKPNRQRPDPVFLEELFEAGAHVFALTAHDDASLEPRYRGKRPLKKGWNSPTAKSLTRDEAAAHMRADRNIGERLTPEDLVIDIDPRNFNDGADYSNPDDAASAAFRALEEWCAEHGIDHSGWPICITGSGGLHVRLKKPGDLAIVTKLEGRPGFEIKTAGTFIVTPGSVHPLTGRLYQPHKTGVRLKDAPLAPAALLELLRRPQPVESVTGGGELEPEEVAELLAALDPSEFREHDKWFSLMCGCHHATNGDGEAEFLAWSAQDPMYAGDIEVTRDRWRSLRSDKPGIATASTLYRAVSNAGRGDLVAVLGGEQAQTEALEALAAEPLDGEASSVDEKQHRWRLWEVEELGQLPPIQWLVEGMIPERGLGQIYGPTKSHKTFVTLAMALSIATGKDFYGVPTKRGRVLYVIGEGQSDVYDRVLAWCITNKVDVNDLCGWFRVVISPVLLDGEEVKVFAKLTAEHGPFDLAVFDTVNRCMQGDENDTRSMTQFVKGCDYIREAFGCAVTVVHHTGWGGQRARGSSVLIAAVDSSIQIKLVDEGASRDTRLLVEHIRAAPPGKELFLTPQSVVTDNKSLRTSIVLRQIDEPTTVSAKDSQRMKREVAKDDLLLEITRERPKQQKDLVSDQQYRAQATVSAFVKELREDGLLEHKALVPTAEGLEHIRAMDPAVAERFEAESISTEGRE